MHLTKPILIVLLFYGKFSFAQDSSRLNKVISFPDKVFTSLDRKTSSIEQKLNKQTIRYLNKLQRQENKLRRKLYRKDSALAKQLFDGDDEKYTQLKNAAGSAGKYQTVYSGHLDSLSTALNFLKDQKVADNPSLQKTLSQYKDLQQKLNASDQIKKQLLLREQALKEQFEKLGMIKELKQFRKNVFYYQQQVKEYKESFEDPSKLEAKLMEAVMKLPQFKNFFARNSILGSLFSIPSNYSTSLALAGLQTRSQIQQQFLQRFATTPVNGVSPQQYMQNQIQQAKNQLSELKDKLSKMGMKSGDGTSDFPNFKPNNQKTRSFFQRLEYGTNIQSQHANNFFPATSDLGLSVGYKLNDKSVIGIGASYKIGLGRGWNHIRFTQEGAGLRSYIDWKAPFGSTKGGMFANLWVTGGYEMNYRIEFNTIDQLKNYNAWQRSALIGVSKKYKLSTKMKGEMKLMYDFLANKHLPVSEPFVFRLGYNF